MPVYKKNLHVRNEHVGLYLEGDNPARYVAAFNDQSEEARDIAKFGYAALQGTMMFLKK